ncbi:hypothetical protein BJY01DRAFT_205543 [Aspergillus pseudoustus]|uniref:Uncharacterized protein n=1 Tax=Aspergillus pseudoustus TaxID=1810923 RepID=A0ABR4KQ39_9EURO
MHTSALVCFALTFTAHAIPLSRPISNTTIQRRSSDYDVVNVGGNLSPLQPPGQETIIQTVTAPGAPQQTVTVTQASSLTSTSTALWTAGVYSSSFSTTPTPTPTPTPPPVPVSAPVPGDEIIPRGFTAMDRLARALGKTFSSHLRARDVKPKIQLSAGSNGTQQAAHSPRGLPNATESNIKVTRDLNGTVLEA